MKKLIYIPIIVALLSFTTFYSATKDHPEGFHFFHVIHLDDEAILTKENRLIQPLMLAKDHDYDFVLKNTSPKSKVLITIKDDRGVIVASNYDSKTETHYKSLVFESHISEFYNIEIKAMQPQKSATCKVYSRCHLNKKDLCKE
jgi:hypothetical protein